VGVGRGASAASVLRAWAARWLEADEKTELERFRNRNPSASAEDHDGVPVFLARNAWDLRTTIEEWPNIRFRETREQN
jgi:peptide chain release factor 3